MPKEIKLFYSILFYFFDTLAGIWGPRVQILATLRQTLTFSVRIPSVLNDLLFKTLEATLRMCQKITVIIAQARGEFWNFNRVCVKNVCCLCVYPSVSSISTHSFEARVLKFGILNYCTYTTKFTNQIFEFLSKELRYLSSKLKP